MIASNGISETVLNYSALIMEINRISSNARGVKEVPPVCIHKKV
jgi:hypothetical protein